jgi:hypothetical protein
MLALAVTQCRRASAIDPEPTTSIGTPRAAVAPLSSAGPDASPTFVRVLARLLDQTAPPELSGIAYSASLGRFLVVSDDTGRKDKGTWHAPWLFTMTASGEMDPDPLPIAGIDQLNDAESITAGPEGTFFLSTSHSPDHKGRTGPDRAMLLYLALEGRSLRVLGRVDLRDLGKSEGGLLRTAGLDEQGRLDIEGVAYRDGDLFIGLKSPLDGDGRASVLRLSRAVETVRKGAAAAGALSLYAKVRLAVATPGGDVFEGVSDLVFLPDGSLLVLANSPKTMPQDGGGSIWRIPTPVGSTAPILVRRFAGLKPEGAALSADAKQVVVVFDRDQAEPMFARIDVPR